MLLHRSILTKVCLLLVVCLVKAQYGYDDEEKKEVKKEDVRERDYAKIFAEETSAALIAAADDTEENPKENKYGTPAEFEDYFKPAHIFGESNEESVKASPEKKKNEHLQTHESKKDEYPSYFDDGPLKDFFDQSEKKQKLHKEQSKKEEEVTRPGPNYISYQVPAHFSYEVKEDGDDRSPSASEDVEKRPSRENKQKSSEEPDFDEGRVEKDDEDYKLPPFTLEALRNDKPKVDYETGKSSSTVSQYPSDAGHDKPAASNPYEQYSFQPVEDTGKSSSSSSQYPSASGYDKPAASTPYEKYSFQPVDDSGKSSSSASQYSSDSGHDEPSASNPYEKYSYQSAEDRGKSSSSPSQYSSDSGHDEPSASNPYEKYNYQPIEDRGKSSSSPSQYSSDSGHDEPSASNPYEKYNYQPVEDRGKSSSSPSKYSSDSGHDKPSASNPYEKYSFQPEDYEAENSKYFDSIVGKANNPYNPTYKKNTEPKYESQPTEKVASQTPQGKGCRKVASSGKDDVNCFICENPKTNAKYTQCSYSSQKKPVEYYEGNSAQYSMPQKEQQNAGYRYKRYAENEENDPYTYIRNRARKASEERGVPKDYGAAFRYEAEHYDETKPELTFSQQHSEELKKNPQNCQKVDKDGMTCTICKDPKSGGNFEQCSYESKPKEKKFAYVTEKKFDNDEPAETQVVSQAKEGETNQKEKSDTASKKNTDFHEAFQSRINQEKVPKKHNEEGNRDYAAKPSEKKAVGGPNYEFPSHFVKTISTPSYDDSIVFKGSSSNVDDKKSADFSDFDEYHFKYFPEFAKQQSKQESKQEPVKESYEVPIPQATKQNVELVLAEFSKKDRSNCKKAEKKGMTCYLCVDKNNIQHEECMYVQESKPEMKHVAYHEVKATEKAKLPEPEPEKNITEAPKQEIKQDPAATETKNRYFFKNVQNPAPLGLEAAASEAVGTFVLFNPDEAKKKQKRSNKNKEVKPEAGSYKAATEGAGSFVHYNPEEGKKKQKRVNKSTEPKPDASAYDSERLDDKADPTIKTPEEFNVAPGEGAYSEETKAVYSKELGVQLPKYMLEKSEFEKEFDAFSGSF